MARKEDRRTYWDMHFVPKIFGGRNLVINQLDEVTKNPIGHTLTIDERLLDGSVQIVIHMDGDYEIVKNRKRLDPTESGIVKPFRRRAA